MGSLRDRRLLRGDSGLGDSRDLGGRGVDVGSSVLRDAEGGAAGDGVGGGTVGDGGGLRADVAGGVDNLGGGVSGNGDRGRGGLDGVGRVLSGSRGRGRGSRVSLVLGSSKGNGGEASNDGEGTHLDCWFGGWY